MKHYIVIHGATSIDDISRLTIPEISVRYTIYKDLVTALDVMDKSGHPGVRVIQLDIKASELEPSQIEEELEQKLKEILDFLTTGDAKIVQHFLKPSPKRPVAQWAVYSFTEPGKEYRVTRWSDGSIGCSCPDYTFRKHICKHIKEVKLPRSANVRELDTK